MGVTDTTLTFGWNGAQHAYDYDVRALRPPNVDDDGLIASSDMNGFMRQIKGEDRRGNASWYTASLMWSRLKLARQKYHVDFSYVCNRCGKGLDYLCSHDDMMHDPRFMKLSVESLIRNIPVLLRTPIPRFGRELTMHFSALLYTLKHGRQE